MNKDAIEKNPVVKLSFEFSLAIISFCEILEQQKKFVLARQLLKSGTSIGANVIEAQNAESKADFIHKFKIAAKEGEETQYWLLLCEFSENYPSCKELLEKIESINKIMSTSKRKNPLSYLLSFLIF
jgi:four helix bundle protein